MTLLTGMMFGPFMNTERNDQCITDVMIVYVEFIQSEFNNLTDMRKFPPKITENNM